MCPILREGLIRRPFQVYAAYDYEAQYEDELDMNDGDEIKVLSKVSYTL